MNPLLGFVANIIIKLLSGGGALPDGGWKSIAGIVIAIIGIAAKYMDIEIPALGTDTTTFIGSLLAAFGLGDKAGRSGGKAI